MSLLVDKQIKKLIDQKEIIIEPFDDKRLGSGSYKLSLGKVLLIPISGERVILGEKIKPSYDRVEIGEEGFTLKPGMFVLGQTLEKITIPKYIGAFLDSRSTMARIGVSVHNTAMYIEPGHKGSIITLELFNEGPFEVVLRPEVGVAKLVFISSSDSATRGYSEYGRYALQEEVTGANLED